jgi:organic radical activating enzyme
MKAFDLRYARHFVASYVDLRMRHKEAILSTDISVKSTNDWLDKNKDGQIHVYGYASEVFAAVIVYPSGEVAVFSDRRKMGDLLLLEAEQMAYVMNKPSLWARKGNCPVFEDLFERNGYIGGTDGIWRKSIHKSTSYGLAKGAEDFPLMLITSMLYVCNAKCPSCPYTQHPEIRESHRDAMFISESLFCRLADECGPHKTLLRLCGGGEPFLHPKLESFVRYAKDKGCQVSIITNGSIDVRSLIDVADMIEFSVDAGCEEEYKKARVGLDWKRLNKNVADAFAARKTTRLICSVIDQNGVDIERARYHWSFLDAVQIRRFLTYFGEVHSDAELNAPEYLQDGIPCPWLFDRMCVNTRGEFFFCGCDCRGKYVVAKLGDPGASSIAEIWKGKKYAEVREIHLAGRASDLEMCRNCDDHKYRSWNYSFWRLRQYADSNKSA